MSDVIEHHEPERGSVLAVGIPYEQLCGASTVCTLAANARVAIELMRVSSFDLLLTADSLPDMPLWHFIGRVRKGWPWQKWALFSKCLNEADEITARTLGVLHVMEGCLDLNVIDSLASTIHRRSGERRIRRAATTAALARLA